MHFDIGCKVCRADQAGDNDSCTAHSSHSQLAQLWTLWAFAAIGSEDRCFGGFQCSRLQLWFQLLVTLAGAHHARLVCPEESESFMWSPASKIATCSGTIGRLGANRCRFSRFLCGRRRSQLSWGECHWQIVANSTWLNPYPGNASARKCGGRSCFHWCFVAWGWFGWQALGGRTSSAGSAAAESLQPLSATSTAQRWTTDEELGSEPCCAPWPGRPRRPRRPRHWDRGGASGASGASGARDCHTAGTLANQSWNVEESWRIQ